MGTAVMALNLLVFAITGMSLYRGMVHQRNEATQVADNLSRVLEENLGRFIEKIDLTLLAVADEVLRQQLAGGIDRPALEAFLARHDGRLPEALGLRVVNAKGVIEYAVSNVVTGGAASVADREHFLRHRDDPQLGLFISPPVVGRLNPQPMIILARRRTGPDGEFAGIVHVAVSVASLQRILSTVDLGEHGSVGLWNRSPILVARTSAIDPAAPPPPSPILRELIAANAPPTAYQTRSGVDGIERMFFYRKIGPWPLFLVVGMADEDYLASWWREVYILGGLSAMFMLASMAAVSVIARALKASEGARAEAEAAQRRSDLILASAGEGICGVDRDGRVTFINAAARSLLGWGEDEGLGWDFHKIAHHTHADGSAYPTCDCPATRLVADGATASPRQIDGEVYWRRDGTSFPVEYTVAPIVENGEVMGVVNLFRDVSERHRIEATLQMSEERAKALLNAPTDVAFLMDRDGIILAGNDAFSLRFGKPVEEMVGKSFYSLLSPVLAAQRRIVVESVLTSGRPVETHDQRDGRELDNRIYPVTDADGVVVQVAVFSRDVTEQRRAAQAVERALADLARSNEELQQFAYVASHDLRQPLRMVSSYLGLIEKRLGSTMEGEVKDFMAFAIAGARRMDRLIIDLLEYSRAGRGTAPFQPFSLGEAVSDALFNLKVAVDESGAEVVVAADLPTVTGDGGELTRLFQNLVGNAIKYRAEGRTPRIEIGWRPEGEGAVVWVQDNGMGIAPDDRERAFRIFQRLVPSGQCEGTGIGLAICRKIVEHHRGRIWIESEPGQGSTFLMSFPSPQDAIAE
ncbi:MAG: PAS domain-containing protein [Actinomycetota bacterium]